MSKKHKKIGIVEAIQNQDKKLTQLLMSKLPLDDYHNVMEEINILIDLEMHAMGMGFEQARSEYEDTIRATYDGDLKAIPKIYHPPATKPATK